MKPDRALIPVVREEETWGRDPELACPSCSDGYVHAKTPIAFYGDDYRSPFGNRGSSYVISFECEPHRHQWVVAFNFHKGRTSVRVETDTPTVKALFNAQPLRKPEET